MPEITDSITGEVVKGAMVTMETPIATLEGEFNALHEQEQRIRLRKRAISEEINRQRIAARPTYPTERQVAGLKVAAELIRLGYTVGDHLGSAAIEGDYSVTTTGGPRGWISVRHQSPWGHDGRGGRLWEFLPEEIAAIKQVLAAEGLEVTDEWEHAEGVSLIGRAQ